VLGVARQRVAHRGELAGELDDLAELASAGAPDGLRHAARRDLELAAGVGQAHDDAAFVVGVAFAAELALRLEALEQRGERAGVERQLVAELR
jgi:hypothetical protein